jgi:hypothetical protein
MASEVNLLALAGGPFIGATLAFTYNRYVEREKRFEEQLVAANLALLTLKNQYNDFLLFRRNFRTEAAGLGVTGTEPLWALLRPAFFSFAEYEVDSKSIGFLLTAKKRKDVFDKIELVQICHRDMRAILELMNENAMNVQKKIAEIHAKNLTATWEELEAGIGRDLGALMNSVAIGLAIRSERNEQIYIEAFKKLRESFLTHFETYKEWVICGCGLPWRRKRDVDELLISLMPPQKGFNYAELCSLPKSLDDAVKLLPQEIDEMAV